MSPTLQVDSLPVDPSGKPQQCISLLITVETEWQVHWVYYTIFSISMCLRFSKNKKKVLMSSTSSDLLISCFGENK